MKVTFWGAAGTVTGSRHLVASDEQRVLLDCGLFQGLKVLRQRNWKPLPFDPPNLTGVVLSHAHVDHSGALPLLVKQGYGGPIYCNAPTAELAGILLRDAAHLQEEDAARANRRGYSKHTPAIPLYTTEDAERAIERLEVIGDGDVLRFGEMQVTLHPAGHILGAAGVRVQVRGQSLWYSADLGRPHDMLMYPPEPARDARWIIMESTYGDQDHVKVDAIQAVVDVARPVLERGGILLIPSFALGRAQTILLAFYRAFEQGLLPRVPVYVNSPMAVDVTALYRRYSALHRLTAEESGAVFGMARFVHSMEESIRLNLEPGPMVVISASGMLTGGRVLHHLVAFGGDPRNAILLPGFQSPGTRGAALAAGSRSVKVHGQLIEVKAEVHTLDVLSAHADRTELTEWLRRASPAPRRVTLVHGEPAASEALRIHLREALGIEPEVADAGETVSAP